MTSFLEPLDFRAKESSSFLKKRSKKLLSVLASAASERLGPNEQKFFGSFFQKRTASLHSAGFPAATATRRIRLIFGP